MKASQIFLVNYIHSTHTRQLSQHMGATGSKPNWAKRV